MQMNAGLTDRQLSQVLKDLTIKFGRKSVEANIKPALINRKTLFSDMFTNEVVNFVDSK